MFVELVGENQPRQHCGKLDYLDLAGGLEAAVLITCNHPTRRHVYDGGIGPVAGWDIGKAAVCRKSGGGKAKEKGAQSDKGDNSLFHGNTFIPFSKFLFAGVDLEFSLSSLGVEPRHYLLFTDALPAELRAHKEAAPRISGQLENLTRPSAFL